MKRKLWGINYDDSNNIDSIRRKQFGYQDEIKLYYNGENQITKIKSMDIDKNINNFEETTTYDGLGRINKLELKNPEGELVRCGEYKFVKNGNNSLNIIEESKINEKTNNYKYDLIGNIIEIETYKGKINYDYDHMNQLIKECNSITGETIDYTYDEGGNILKKNFSKG